MDHKNNFTEGKILPPLIKFTFPILLALFLQAMYGAVDLIVVGQFGTAASVSAVATGSTMMHTITMLITGLTMGATVLIGQRIGEKNFAGASKAIGAAICLFLVVAAVVTVFMLFFARTFATLMQAPKESYEKTVEYVIICTVGTIFIVGYNVISGIFRGIGNSKLPLLFVAIACVTNIAGDLLLVGVFHLDVAGAAYATIFAQAVSVVLSVLIIRRQNLPFSVTRQVVRFHKQEVLQIFKLGLPIALQDTLTSISFLVVNSLINAMGLIYSAGYGIAQKVTTFVLLIPISYMSAMSAFVAQNIGAQKKQRAKKAMLYGMGTALGVGVFMFLLSFFFGDILVSIFSREADILFTAKTYMQGFSFDCIMVSVLFCYTGYFNGCGKTMFVMLQGLIGAFLVRIPFSYLMSITPGTTLFHMGLATPLASAVSIVICFFYYKFAAWNRSDCPQLPLDNT